MRRTLSVLVALLILLPAIPVGFASGQGVTTTSIPANCKNCQSTNATQIVPYSIKQGQFALDLGPITYATSLQGFTFNVTASQSLTFGLPSPASSILFNSTLTSIQLSGINFFYKPQGYHTLITITGTGTGAQVCIPLTAVGGQIVANNTLEIASVGPNQLSWSDIPASMLPSFAAGNLCYTPPVGAYSIDPLAIDGSGTCQTGVSNTCNMVLTTSNSNDVIIVLQTCISGGGCGTFTTATASGLTFTERICWMDDNNACSAATGPINSEEEDYAIAASPLSSTSITCTQSFNPAGKVSCLAFGISGASTGSPFDGCSSGSPSTAAHSGSAASIAATCTTSNANDIIIGLFSNLGATTTSTPSGSFTAVTTNYCSTSQTTDGNACGTSLVVSSTQTALSVGVTFSPNPSTSVAIADAIKQAVSTVSQGINITTANSAPACSVGITGGSPSNSSFLGNGNLHTYSLTASTTITLTLTASTNTRCEWNVSPHPTASLTITFVTCALPGPCSQITNTSYYQHRDNYTATPVGPIVWDVTTPFTVTGTYLGAASQTLGTGTTIAGGGTATISFVWTDYNQAATVQSPIHSNWNAFPTGSNVFTQTTGGHSNNVNYAITAPGGSASSNYLWMLLIPFLLIGIVLLGKGKRLRI